MTYKFLTSNKKKATDFQMFGFNVQEFLEEIPEIKHDNVEHVALYKAKAVNLVNIVVEDTALDIEGAKFPGTEIKHVIEEIQSNDSFQGATAIWRVCLCLKTEDKYLLATGETKGELMYPVAPEGYHFEKVFAIKQSDKKIHFCNLLEVEKRTNSPRFKALTKLHDAILNNDFSQLKVINSKDVLDWSGEYQEENKTKKLKIK